MICRDCGVDKPLTEFPGGKRDPRLIWAAIDYLDPVPVEELIQ